MHHVLLEVRTGPSLASPSSQPATPTGCRCSALFPSSPKVEVLEGTLQCPESGRMFPISRGIPNMLLSSEETET